MKFQNIEAERARLGLSKEDFSALPILWWIATKSVLFLLLKNWKEKGVTPPFLYSCCPRYLQTPILPGLHYWTSSEFF